MENMQFELLIKQINELNNKIDIIMEAMNIDQKYYCESKLGLIEKSELEWIDKFEKNGDTIYWYYYNSDGNDGNGQIVEKVIRPENVLLNVSEDTFWDHLSTECNTYLYDRGDKYFDGLAEFLLEKVENSDRIRNDASTETMRWIVEWAMKNR